ncbi:MAG: lysophospholipid acyltransferase family protein [Pirellulales bacterium]|nr:lysophospholipid acyltransferase family protein [Pirellulales bacterium]
MKIRSPFLFKLAGLLTTSAVRHWMGTLDYKVAYYDPTIDPAFGQCGGQKVYVFWHEYILFPFYLRGHNNMAMLLSRHQDAEVLSYAARYMGFDFVRGSTNRGGVTAIRELLRKSRDMHLAITPDGPRGPRRRLAPGPIYLASRLQLPLVALGFGFDRPWRVRRAWDQFAIPRPYSRARAVPSGELHIPRDLDRAGIEHFRQRIETLLTRLTLEAETWAASGTRKLTQQPLAPRPAPLPTHRLDPPTLLPGPHRRPVLSVVEPPPVDENVRVRRGA